MMNLPKRGLYMADEKKVEIPKEKPLFKDKSAAGKGDRPRNISRGYWENFDDIKGFKKSKFK